MNPAADVWSKVITLMQPDMTATTINTWFDDATAVALEDDRFVLYSPTRFKRDIIASRYVNLHANSNIYGNALEALFGAIYLDQGYRKCKTFVEERLFSHILDWNDILQKEINYKSRVLEWCHKRHIEPEFDLLNETVQRNKHTFHTCLKIQGHIISQATGGSKKESQQKAAEIAYKKMCADPHFLEKIIEQPQPTEE